MQALTLCCALLLATPATGDPRVAAQLRDYAHHFPQIEFLHLAPQDGASAWAELERRLGPEPRDAVYAHPPALAGTLRRVSLTRTRAMWLTGRSAASFYLKDPAVAGRARHLCVISLDPARIAGDPDAATRSLLDETLPGRGDGGRTLTHEPAVHLRFVVDHEVFHCLDRLLNGPVPRSHAAHWGGYHAHLGEQGADAYALARHLIDHGAVSDYARNLLRLRSLALLSDDIAHYTVASLLKTLGEDPLALAELTPRALAVRVSALRDAATRDHATYLSLRSTAAEARLLLGLKTAAEQPAAAPAPVSARARELAGQLRGCYRAQFGRPLSEAAQPPPRPCAGIP
jgi:hypothetical protein